MYVSTGSEPEAVATGFLLAPSVHLWRPKDPVATAPGSDSLRCFHGLQSATIKLMQERDIFDEKQETKTANFACPNCRERADYDVRWVTRRKKRQEPRNMSQQDRSQFQKSRDYMVRVDDMLMCKNMRCRKRFEIPSSQSVVFI